MAMVTLQVVLAAIMAAIAFLQCSPVERLWNGGIEGSCWHPSVLNNYSYFVSAYTTLTDLVLAIVPISAFWNLQMNTSTKIGIMVLMGLTFLSAVVTVVKARYLHLFNDTEDPCKSSARPGKRSLSQKPPLITDRTRHTQCGTSYNYVFGVCKFVHVEIQLDNYQIPLHDSRSSSPRNCHHLLTRPKIHLTGSSRTSSFSQPACPLSGRLSLAFFDLTGAAGRARGLVPAV